MRRVRTRRCEVARLGRCDRDEKTREGSFDWLRVTGGKDELRECEKEMVFLMPDA